MTNSNLPLVVTGTVVEGDKVGRTLNFPTANLDLPEELAIAQGVYAGFVEVPTSSRPLASLIYYGPRLIFGEHHTSFEVFIYDFNQNLYGQHLSVSLKYFIRKPLPFTSLEALKIQMEQDKERGWVCLTTPSK